MHFVAIASLFWFICLAGLQKEVFDLITKMVDIFAVLADTKIWVAVKLLLITYTIVLLASVTLAIASFANQ